MSDTCENEVLKNEKYDKRNKMRFFIKQLPFMNNNLRALRIYPKVIFQLNAFFE